METILFHYAHTMYIKWVRGTAERCEVAQPEWKPWDKTKPWGGGEGEIRDTCLGESVWNRSIWKEKSHFQKSRARSNPGHFYQFADSCLLRNKLDQTAKEKLVLARILTVCHKKKKNAQEECINFAIAQSTNRKHKTKTYSKCPGPVWPMKKLSLMLLEILSSLKKRQETLLELPSFLLQLLTSLCLRNLAIHWVHCKPCLRERNQSNTLPCHNLLSHK